jgi:tRNA modification GTPase
LTDTIFALSSAPGRAGIAVIRVSGPEAATIYRVLTQRSLPAPRIAILVRLLDPADGGLMDEGLALWFPGPRSYTGEDSVEFHVHGGVAVVSVVLESMGRVEGARPAEPGEFTRRAFLSGKIDLTEAEGVIDLIDAETSAQRRQALRQAGGALGALYDHWRDRLVAVLAHFEAVLDFPDEELPEDVVGRLKDNILGLDDEISLHLDDNRCGERLRNGVRIAIIGPPNAGKSSLMNLLAQRDVAIVSETAGTTRDVIETHLDLGGLPVSVVDTAGLREAVDAVEAEGVRRARRAAEEADLKVLVLDRQALGAEDERRDQIDAETIVVVNKSDLGDGPEISLPSKRSDTRGRFLLSVKTGEGVDAFIDGMTSAVRDMLDVSDAPIITRARHRAALEDVRQALTASQSAPLPELAAEDIRLAVRALGRITGSVDVEDLLDVVFRDFCIGK